MITKYQEKMLIAAFILLAIDAVISIYGVTVYNSTFYEANPILALSGNVDTFISLVVISKMFAATTLVIIVAYLNTNLNERWGNAACYLSVIMTAGPLLVITIINLVINFW